MKQNRFISHVGQAGQGRLGSASFTVQTEAHMVVINYTTLLVEINLYVALIVAFDDGVAKLLTDCCFIPCMTIFFLISNSVLA